jgi:CobQ-like glutamine amidotransferase family enzyme
VPVERADDLPSRVDAVILGSGSDGSLETSRTRLLEVHDELRRWGTEGVPILAVGTGWELLSWGIERVDGGTVEGLGIVAGRAVVRDDRVAGELVVKAGGGLGVLVGFENHARDYVGAEASPLGRVQAGSGNGRGSGQEGLRMGEVIGTHLHGPVLAKNPKLADAILERMCARAGSAYEPGEQAAVVDRYADSARTAQLRAAGVAASVVA